MLAAVSDWSQAARIVDVSLLGAGGLCLLAFIGWLVGSGRWRNPLAGVECSGQGPRPAQAALAVALYLFVGVAGMTMLVGEAETPPGSHAWHLSQQADMMARVAAIAFMLPLLRRARSFVTQPGRPSAARVTAAAVVATLVIAAVCTVQLHAGTVVYRWLRPGVEPPRHEVLVALHQSEWGGWGTAQLCLAAVVLAPLAEELFFRGVLLQMLWRYVGHAWLAVLLSGAAFGAIHQQPQDVLPLVTMGVILGYLRLRSGSLAVCVLAHALFNARTMAQVVLFPEIAG